MNFDDDYYIYSVIIENGEREVVGNVEILANERRRRDYDIQPKSSSAAKTTDLNKRCKSAAPIIECLHSLHLNHGTWNLSKEIFSKSNPHLSH